MRALSDFIVEKSKLVLTVFVLLALVGAWLMTTVTINTDMTKYLPDDSPTRLGIDIMDEEFPDSSTLNLMFGNLAESEKQSIYDELTEMENVQNVSFEAGSAQYEKDGYTLYAVTLGLAAGSPEAIAAVDGLKARYADYDLALGGDAAGNTAADILPKLAGVAFAILFVILLLMCQSWIEPIIFLASIAAAVLLNMGTNVIFPSVSDTTHSIAAILQLCLSMDYSMMLMNRYRQEKRTADNKKDAMKKALRNAFTAITSSSVTTIVGMLALVFMSFTIGRDMGFVLAKGVFFSLVCIFTVLPALILIFDKPIEKTAKRALHIRMDKIAAFSFRARYVIPAVFAVILVGSFFLRGSVGISYTMSDYNTINEAFTPDNPVVVIYENGDEDKIGALAEKWDVHALVDGVDAYATTLGRPLDYAEMADAADMDETFAALLYDDYFSRRGELPEETIVLGDFLQFVREDVASDERFAPFFTEDMAVQFGAMSAAGNGEALQQALTARELAAYTGMDEAAAVQLYSYYAVVHGDMPAGKISMDDFIRFIAEDVLANEQFKSFLTDDDAARLERARTELDDARGQLVGGRHSRLIINTSLPEESEEAFDFIAQLQRDLSGALAGEHYVVGNTAMAYEMSGSFPGEMNLITLLTVVAIFVVIALSFRSLSVPLILVCIIQCAVFITMGIAYFQGSSIYYLPLLIVQCLLLGATVDYGILYASYYREARSALGKREAVAAALNNSIHTILTSATILIVVTGVLGLLLNGSDRAISEILMTIAKGGLSATVLIVFILPGLMVALDRFVVGKKRG